MVDKLGEKSKPKNLETKSGRIYNDRSQFSKFSCYKFTHISKHTF